MAYPVVGAEESLCHGLLAGDDAVSLRGPRTAFVSIGRREPEGKTSRHVADNKLRERHTTRETRHIIHTTVPLWQDTIMSCIRLRGSKTSSLSEVNLVMQPPVPSGEQNLALRTLRLRRANCKRKNVHDCVCVCVVVCSGVPKQSGV